MAIPLWRAAFGLSDAEVVTELDQIVAAERALAVRRVELAAEVSGRRIAKAHGCPALSQWLRNRYLISDAAAARLTSLAKHLPSMPQLTAALGSGVLSEEQTEVAAAAIAALPEGMRAEGERYLVEHGAVMEPKVLRAFGRGIIDVIAPDVAEERARREFEQDEKRANDDRSFTVSPDGTGRYRIHGYTSAEGAATFSAALDPLANPARCKAGLFADADDDVLVPSAFKDSRTAAQRRHDALLEVFGLALNSGDLPANGGDKAQVVVTMQLDPLAASVKAGLLDNGAKLSPEAVRRLACDAGIIPAICDGNGVPLDLGRERRLITGALRRALVLRDRGCAFPGCDRPPKWCHAHHVVHWINGGPTSLANSVLVCGFHHQALHHGDWTVHVAADGMPEFVAPAHLDPFQRPQRNIYHHRT